MRNIAYTIRAKAREYKNQEDGATAIEFAMLIIPFSALLFSVLELGIIFFLSSAMSHALSEASRDVRVGSFQANCGTAATFKQTVCDGMSGGSKCMSRLRIDVKTTSSGKFEPNMLPDFPKTLNPGDPGYDPSAPPVIEPDQLDPTVGLSPVIARAQYYYKLNLPSALTRLNNTTGNVRILESVTAFQNEPFSDGC